MKTSRFSDTQIIPILKQGPSLISAANMASARPPSYKWRSKFGGMDASLMARLKVLEDENRRLKKMYAEECLRPRSSPRPWQKSGNAISPPGDGDLGRGSLRHINPLGLPGVQI